MAKILIVEDSADEREALAELLSGHSHQVVCVPNGKAALQHIRETSVELVITDMIMPEMDGVETIVALRQDFPTLKIIAMSGGGVGGFDKYKNLARNLGVRTFVAKPYTSDEILGAVQSALKPR